MRELEWERTSTYKCSGTDYTAIISKLLQLYVTVSSCKCENPNWVCWIYYHHGRDIVQTDKCYADTEEQAIELAKNLAIKTINSEIDRLLTPIREEPVL